MIDITSDEMKHILGLDKLRNSNLRRGRPTKSERVANIEKYRREKLIGSFTCPICNTELRYKTSVNNHMQKNKRCNLIRLEKEAIESPSSN